MQSLGWFVGCTLNSESNTSIVETIFSSMTDATKKAELMEMMRLMIEERGFVAYSAVEEKMIEKFPDLQDPDGKIKSTIPAYMNKSSHISNMQNPIYGEGSGSNVDIRKTMFKIGGKGHAKIGICHHSFDDEITTEKEYEKRVYSFTQDEWNQQMREKPSDWNDKDMSKSVVLSTEEVPSDDNGTGNPDGNEREIRYAEILNRRKNIVLEGPPGTGKTYAIEGIVDELRSRSIDVGGDGEGEFAITMHPATSYEDFIEGLRPIGNGDFGYKPGVFLQRIRDAIRNPLKQHVILLDELNRSNVPRVLGDLLTTLEPSKRTKPIFSDVDNDGFSDFKFASATIAKPGDGAQTGLRFSVPLMRNANSGQGDVRYLCNPREYEIQSGSKSEKARDFSKSDFDGNYGALHSILDKINLYEIVFIFINGVAHPVVSPEVVERIITGQDLGSISKIEILFEEGIRTYFADDLTCVEGSDFDNGKVAGSISLNLSIPLSNNHCNCYDENGKENDGKGSDYYWCKACDDMWDYSYRTEVSLSGSKKLLHVPNNLLVVATMNTTDRSVAPLDAALRRRFVFLRVDPLDKIPRKAKRNLNSEKLKIFNETEKLWIKLNENLTTTLGHDATIGHSYLFDLIKELERAESIDMCYELRRQFWQYSVLPQVADLLDATGRSNSVWAGMKMEESFKRIGLGLDTGPEKFKSFARTIVVGVEDDEEDSIDTNQTEEESETTEDTEAIESSSDEND